MKAPSYYALRTICNPIGLLSFPVGIGLMYETHNNGAVNKFGYSDSMKD